jgi:protein-S-isoprenylcysteine O-methyltransferase Ste14
MALFVLLVPFAFAPDRLLHPSPWILVLAVMAVYLGQPTPGRKAFADPVDKGSAQLIIIGGNVSTLLPVVEFVARSELAPRPLSAWVVVGALGVAAGAVLRIRAVTTLGRFFTAVVQVQAGQRVIREGPYAWVRHPSYSGVLLVLLGEAALFQSAAGLFCVVLAMLPIYMYRIRIEEKALLEGLGDEYRRYQEEVGALVPRLGRSETGARPL